MTMQGSGGLELMDEQAERQIVDSIDAASVEVREAVSQLRLNGNEYTSERACMAIRDYWDEFFFGWREYLESRRENIEAIAHIIDDARQLVAEIHPKSEYVEHCLRGIADKQDLLALLVIDQNEDSVLQVLRNSLDR
jgi:hypothetical protein